MSSSEGRHPLVAGGHGLAAFFDFNVHFEQQGGFIDGSRFGFPGTSILFREVLSEAGAELQAAHVVFEGLDAGVAGLADLGIFAGKGAELVERATFLVIVGHAQVGDEADEVGGLSFSRIVLT